MSDFLAGAQTDAPFTPVQLFAGSSPVLTEPGTLVTGQNLAAYTVLARVAATGKLTQWAPAGSGGPEKAVGILMHTTDATAADKGIEMYTAGDFNTNALVWPGGVTAAQKAYAFDNTKMSHRPLGYSG
jgi:hypothetical protein